MFIEVKFQANYIFWSTIGICKQIDFYPLWFTLLQNRFWTSKSFCVMTACSAAKLKGKRNPYQKSKLICKQYLLNSNQGIWQRLSVYSFSLEPFVSLFYNNFAWLCVEGERSMGEPKPLTSNSSLYPFAAEFNFIKDSAQVPNCVDALKWLS